MTEQVLLFNRQPDRPLSLDEYRAHGGYEALIETVKKLTPEEVRQAVLDSKLRGRGQKCISGEYKNYYNTWYKNRLSAK
ncbi:MAG: hypothetical protein P8X49_10235 [Syntrophobacterales bacterium]